MPSSRTRRTPRRRRTLTLLAAVALVALVALATAAVELQASVGQESGTFQLAKQRLDLALQAANDAGYTDQQLADTRLREADLAKSGDPIWVRDRPGYYQRRAAQLDLLRLRLGKTEASLFLEERQIVAATLQAAARQLTQATTLGAQPNDVAPLRTVLVAAEDAQIVAKEPRDLAAIRAKADVVLSGARRLASAEEADLAAIAEAAQVLQAQDASDPAMLRKAAQLAIATGRNEATVGAYLKLPGVAGSYSQLERYSEGLQAAGDAPAELALAAAGAQHYQAAIHAALLAAMPHKLIVMSYQAQALWAYEDGKLVQYTLVTTGRPQLPTDIGAMKVLSKNSPWTMRSPWPRSSPWWYPNTVVQMAIWFTVTGEAMHDAYWEGASQYGPGGQYGSSASHGCVHVPLAAEKFLYSWADIRTPVVFYPGDGSTVPNQVAQITVDANGNPTSGPKGV